MKIVLTGGGTGGHFYPLIAVSEEITNIIDSENLADIQVYYLSDQPFDKKALFENNIDFKKISSGRINSLGGIFQIIIGIFEAIFILFSIYPDVVFSKGGFSAFPTVFAAKLFGIPIIIHESDSVPGRVNKWSGSFARAIAVSYKQEVDYFPKDKIIHTGQPIRRDLLNPANEGAYEFLNLEKETPIIWVLGGSQGSQVINSAIEEVLPELLEEYQIIHQVGATNYEQMKKLTDATLLDHNFKYRYHIFDQLNILSMKMIAGISDIVISRAGSTLFEIAHWEIPAIIIPLKTSYADHQIKNAYNYAREGACVVIEENNISDQLLVFEINRIIKNKEVQNNMKQGARNFCIDDAAKKIAEEVVGIALAHEK